MKKFLRNMKQKITNAKNRIVAWAKEKPENALTLAAAAITLIKGFVSLLTAVSKYQNALTWRREVLRREKLKSHD